MRAMPDSVVTFLRLLGCRARLGLLVLVWLSSLVHCATTASSIELSTAPGQPKQAVAPSAAGVVGLYKLSALGRDDRPIFLWVTAVGDNALQFNLLAHLWRAHGALDGTQTVWVASDRRAPRVRMAEDGTLVLDRLNDALRSELGDLPMPFMRHRGDGAEEVLRDLSRGREFFGVYPDTDALPTDAPVLRVSDGLKLVCKGPYCDFYNSGECKRTVYVFSGFASELEGGPPGGPIVLVTAGRAGTPSNDCGEDAAGAHGATADHGYAYFDERSPSILGRLDSHSRLGMVLLVEGMGQQPYVPAGWSGGRAGKELVDWDRAMHEADQAALIERERVLDGFRSLAEDAIIEPARVPDFVEFVRAMDRRYWDPALHTRTMEKVIRHAVVAESGRDARLLFELFLKHLLPHVRRGNQFEGRYGVSAQEIAADMLVIVAREHDDILFDKVYDQALGGEAAVAVSTHGRVLFNLACYYALKRQKPQMLTAMRRALKQGKGPEQFRADPDFTAYLADPDFVQLLANYEAASGR